MGRPLCLRPRLMAVVSCIPPGHRVADIGTDHARLPVYLLERGHAEVVIASDIRQGPLDRAARTIAAHRLTGKIGLRLCDGLAGIAPDEADSVVITGMGGDTIIEILRDVEWIKAKNLILQPMTHPDRLAAWLLASGFREPRRLEVSEGRRTYFIFHIEESKDDEQGQRHSFGA